MRKIEQMMVGAVVVHQNWKSGNTRVEICQKDGADRYAKVYLYENLISIVDYVRMTVTLYTGGWYSNTTKSRLNALCNKRIKARDFTWYIKAEFGLQEFVNGVTIPMPLTFGA